MRFDTGCLRLTVALWIGDARAAEPIIALANHGGFGFAACRCLLQVLIVVDCCIIIHETFFTEFGRILK